MFVYYTYNQHPYVDYVQVELAIHDSYTSMHYREIIIRNLHCMVQTLRMMI